ncbi:unnamed protein product, partial [Prorocentrum cordatum]
MPRRIRGRGQGGAGAHAGRQPRGPRGQARCRQPAEPERRLAAQRDWTHWTRKQVAEAVKGLRHTGGSGCILDTVELLDKSKVECSITTKKGVRALYYEMDLEVSWKGRAAPRLRPQEGSGELDGVIRVYNIAHDTTFQLGGPATPSRASAFSCPTQQVQVVRLRARRPPRTTPTQPEGPDLH